MGTQSLVLSTPAPESTGPVITNITATPVSDTSETISWQLDMHGTGQVDYCTDAYWLANGTYDQHSTPELSYLYNNHIQTLTGLVAGTRYHYRVRSSGPLGAPVESASVDQTFTTTGSSVIVGTTYGGVFSGDATGASDISSALTAFLEASAGKTVALAVNGIYTGHAIYMRNIANIQVDWRGSEIRNNVTGFGILRVVNCTDCVLNDPKMTGTGYVYTDPTQWDHGIDVAGGNRVTVNHPIMRDHRGDGVCFGLETGPYTPGPVQNGLITNPDIERCGRNNISLIAGHLDVQGGHCWDGGLCNIDYEPNNASEAASMSGSVVGVDLRRHAGLAATAYAWSGGDAFAFAAAGIGRAVDDDRVPAARFADEAHPVDPLNPCLHAR